MFCTSLKNVIPPTYARYLLNSAQKIAKKCLSVKYLFYKTIPVYHLLEIQHPIASTQTASVLIW